MKRGIILAIITLFLVGISSGGFIGEPAEEYKPSWASYGIFDEYEPLNWGDGWLHPGYEPFDLSAWLYPEPAPATDDDSPQWEPVPLVLPEPLPVSKQELFGSLTTVSENKQSVLSFHKTGYYS